MKAEEVGVQQRRLRRAVPTALLVLVAVLPGRPTGSDDPSVLVPPDVDGALAAAERTGRELLDQTGAMRA